MEILKHFDSKIEGDYIIFTLKDEEWDEFFSKLPVEFRGCFISNKSLDRLTSKLGKSKKEIILDRIPKETGSVKAGDFGEILAYYLFKEKYKSNNFDGIKRWRFKDRPERSEQGVDVTLWSVDIAKPSSNDILLTAESKTMASGEGEQVQSSIEGASADFGFKAKKDKKTGEIKDWKKSEVSRSAENLVWLRTQTENELEKENTNEEEEDVKKELSILDRFINSQEEKYGKYTKYTKAITFIDKDFFEGEVKKSSTIPNIEGLNLEIYIVGIKNLKDLYEKVYSEIPNIC